MKDFRVEQFGWKDEKTHEKILQDNVNLEDGLLTGNDLIVQNTKEFGRAGLAYIRHNCKISQKKNNTGNNYQSDDRRHAENANARIENEYQDHPEGRSGNGFENEYQDVIKRDHHKVDIEKN